MQVFYTSPWVPPEWIKAHGLEPRGVWFAGDFSPLPLAAGVCAFAESVVRLAETHPDSAIIFSTHCDQLRRGFDVVAGAAPGASSCSTCRRRGRQGLPKESSLPSWNGWAAFSWPWAESLPPPKGWRRP